MTARPRLAGRAGRRASRRDGARGPPRTVETPSRAGGQADHAPVALEPVDVAVGDLEGRAQATRRRLQDLVEVEGRGQLEARVEQELVALLGACRRRGGATAAGSAGPCCAPGRRREKRRWPLGVRRQASLPESAQRRTVVALTPSRSAACCTRSQSGVADLFLIVDDIGSERTILDQLCYGRVAASERNPARAGEAGSGPGVRCTGPASAVPPAPAWPRRRGRGPVAAERIWPAMDLEKLER